MLYSMDASTKKKKLTEVSPQKQCNEGEEKPERWQNPQVWLDDKCTYVVVIV